MRKIVLLVVILSVVMVERFYAQFHAEGVGVGIVGGGLLGYNKETQNDIRYLGRAFLRHNYSSLLQGEFGGGFGEMRGFKQRPTYKSTLIPIDYRFLLSPFSETSWNLYFYAGAGAINYNVTQSPQRSSPRNYVATKVVAPDKLKGWTPYVPVGVGVQLRLSTNITFEVNGGYNQTLSDDVNGIRKGTGIFQRDGYFTLQLGLMTSGPSGYADLDGDGLSLKIEKDVGTNPEKFDTDGDGLSDGEEYSTFFTDMLLPDGDGDGLSDADEVKIYKTDANKFDTDSDHLSDADEVKNYQTNPTRGDTDMDGFLDDEEVKKYFTNPLSKDTDSDELTDYDELKTYKTDPLKADTDGDGISDSDELAKFKSNPLNADTDSGTIADGIEISRGTNPLDPTDDLPKKEVLKVETGKKIILEGVTFPSGKATLEPSSESILEQAYNTLVENPDIVVEIQGHTDNKGKNSTNIKLSQARADAVKEWLVNKDIDQKRIVTKGYGPDKPIADNNTPEGRQKNRRIEFLRLK